MLAALSGFGFVCSLFVRGNSLKRKIVHRGDDRAVCIEKAVGPLAVPEEKKKVSSVEVEVTRAE